MYYVRFINAFLCESFIEIWEFIVFYFLVNLGYMVLVLVYVSVGIILNKCICYSEIFSL